MNYFIRNCTIVNEGETYVADVLVENGLIKHIFRDEGFDKFVSAVTVEALGRYLIPGVIDEHVHFREPGLTHKGDIFTESRAAVAGGVTSFMEMPNTVPQTTTQELLRQKFELAAEKSIANYSFYMGATNNNLDEVLKTDPASVCGIKVFMGSSTGNMLMNDDGVLARIFKESPCLVAAHCEDEDVIRQNTELYKELVAQGKVTPDATLHPLIRTAEACYRSSAKAVEIADKTGGRLHVMHVSTQRELDLFRNDIPLAEKKITAETCPHYLLFDEQRYRDLGFRIKCNPAVKSAEDAAALICALREKRLDTIGSDHAPHAREEKFGNDYFKTPSGMPSVQHTLRAMLELRRRGLLSLEEIVQLMCHNPATIYGIQGRGFIREGYHADLVMLDLDMEDPVNDGCVLSKCGWTPYNGMSLPGSVTHTFVNGNLVYEEGVIHEGSNGKRLDFSR